MIRKRLLLVAVFVLVSILICICAVVGYPNNPTVYPNFYSAVLHKSNKPGFSTSGQGCGAASGCHGTAASGAITASISGPASLFPGQTGTYTLSTTETVATNTPVGFDIAADDTDALGLVIGEPTYLVTGPTDPSGTSPEVVHGDVGVLRSITTASPTVTHQFTYTMPASATVGGTHNLYAVTVAGFPGGYQFAPTFVVTATAPPQASGLAVTNLTSSSMSLNWSGSSPEFRVLYKLDSVPTSPTDGTLISEGSATTADVTGLSASRRYFIAVYGKASGSSTYSTAAATTSVIMLDGQSFTNDAAEGIRHSDTSQGQVLFYDSADTVKLYNGSSVISVQTLPSPGEAIDNTKFSLGSGSSAGHVIGGWRRGTDHAWFSVDGGTPVLVNATNPYTAGDPMNPEDVAIADGSLFVGLEYAVGGQNIINVFKVTDLSNGDAVDLTGAGLNPGLVDRIRTSEGKAVWEWNDGTGADKLDYYDGSSVRVLDSGVADPWISRGKIVYVKPVGGVAQVFLYDTTAGSPAPVQLTSYTDATATISFAQTDGWHVAWVRTAGSNSEVDLGTGIQLDSGVTALTTELPCQLDRGQILWNKGGRLWYRTSSGTSLLHVPGTANHTWLTDGDLAFNDSAAAGGFLYTGSTPTDTQTPVAPLVVKAAPGTNAIALSWDAIIGASSYDIYYANQPGVTKANYASLLGGTRLTGITGSSFTVTGLAANRPYYFVVTTVDGTGEGPESPQASTVLIGSLAWSAVGGLSGKTMYTVAADRTESQVAYGSGGSQTYMTSNGGFSWTALGGGIAGANVRAMAADSGRVFATTPTGSIYRSVDGGTTWTNILSASGVGEQVQSIAIDPAIPNTIVAGDFQLSSFNGGTTDSYVIRTDDGGSNWWNLPQFSGGDLRAYSLAFDPTHTSNMFAAGTGTPNVAGSIAGGAGWTDDSLPTNGSASGYVYSVAVDPTNPLIVYAGIQQAFGSGSAGVWKSTDGGATWTLMNNGLVGPPAVHALLIDPADHNVLHLGTESGYFYSTDGGGTWTAANSGLSTPNSQFIYALAMTGSHRLIAATADGLYLLNLDASTAPSVAAVSPSSGPLAGGTSVTITGSGFESGAMVTFGGNAATGATVVNATTITATTPSHAAGTVNVAVTNGDGQTGTLTNGFTYGVSAPANLAATASSQNSIAVSWSAVSGATSYEVARSVSGLTFSIIGTSTSTSYDDVSPSPNTSYLYEVRAVDGSGSRSAYSNMDLATTIIFTDATITAGLTIVKAVHITELRTAVNAVRKLAFGPAGTFSFTDPTLTSGMAVRAVHISELRAALDQARSQLTLPALSYTDPTLTPGVTPVKGAHLQELRNGVK